MVQDELRSLIESHYNIENIGGISKLEGGYWNQTLKLETDKSEFVLRLSPPRTKPESVFSQHELMRFMNKFIVEVPLPIAAKNGTTFFVHENQVVSLLPFMRGEMIERGNPIIEKSAAQMLAKLHRTALEYPKNFVRPNYERLSDFNWDENSNWSWTEIQNLLESGTKSLKKRLIAPIGEQAFDYILEIIVRTTQIEEERDKAKNWVADLNDSREELVFAPTHGDYYPSNLLTVDNQISAVLDWDECRSDWLVGELGRATWEFCRDEISGGLKPASAAAFIKSYTQVGGVVPTSEFDLLIPFICCIRIQEVLFSLGEALRGEWWEPEYILYNLMGLDNLPNTNLL